MNGRSVRDLPQVLQGPFSFAAMLESQDKVFSMAHDDDITLCMTAPPLVCPQVQDVMKIHISKQERQLCPLQCSHRGLAPGSVLGHAGFEPFTDEAENPAIGDPVCDEFEQPFVVHGIQESLNVRIAYHFTYLLTRPTYRASSPSCEPCEPESKRKSRRSPSPRRH